ncbi:hypothetical protein [Caballeronia humi]|uniref:hypothetical protein n=1 Tax=Caballeronia humi TaxID=326474 RepID=UPI000F7384DE|nr:hypothetical protein [Caballeronia humi]
MTENSSYVPRNLVRAILLSSSLLVCHAGIANPNVCERQNSVKVAGDVPAAISYDVFSAIHPIVASRIASLMPTQQVKMLHDGTRACIVADDGVADPSAVLLRIPTEPVNYWVRRWDISPG